MSSTFYTANEATCLKIYLTETNENKWPLGRAAVCTTFFKMQNIFA